MTLALLKVEDLKLHFPVGAKTMFGGRQRLVRAVDGVSLELREGETLGIVGESGSGKTTLGRAILRLIEPTDGRILWLGEDLRALAPEPMRQMRRNMQIIFQDPLASLDPRMSVETIIGKPLRTFHPELDKSEVRRRVLETMELVGLAPDMANRYPHEFSGGQCQRIGIARAIILKPKLLVCDEAVSALDVSIQAQIINLLMKLQRELGIALLFISHNLAVVRHISHRVLVLYLGKIMEIASRDDLYSRPLHPYTSALISAVPVADPRIERSRPRELLEGDLPSPLNPPPGCRFQSRCPRATSICRQVEPPIVSYGSAHQAACHHIENSPA